MACIDHPDYIALVDLAADLGFSLPTVRKLATDHRVQFFKLAGDRRTYVRREDVPTLTVPVAKAAPWTADDLYETE